MKTLEDIRDRLAQVEADVRIHYPPATVQVNAPLALIQVNLDTESRALRWVLDMEPLKKKKQRPNT